jgi:hypothetical protein
MHKKWHLTAFTQTKMSPRDKMETDMYNRDCKKIAKFALKNPDNFARVTTFVLTTIQAGLSTTPMQMDDIDINGADSKYLWGNKRDGYLYMQEHKRVIYAAIKEAVKTGDAVAAIDVLTNVPNLGVVKAAFVAQMCGLDVACIDSHNCDRLGLSRSALKFPKGVKPETKRKKIADYVQFTRDTGGAEYWWNSWCDYVAGNRANKKLTTGDEVSMFHVVAVMG